MHKQNANNYNACLMTTKMISSHGQFCDKLEPLNRAVKIKRADNQSVLH